MELMARTAAQPSATQSTMTGLERGEIHFFPAAPFWLPADDDLQFLQGQRLVGHSHKAISCDPKSGRISGHGGRQKERLVYLLTKFAAAVDDWLATAFPSYGAHSRPDRVNFRPDEEATRRLRLTARNDLLHLDAFPK